MVIEIIYVLVVWWLHKVCSNVFLPVSRIRKLENYYRTFSYVHDLRGLLPLVVHVHRLSVLYMELRVRYLRGMTQGVFRIHDELIGVRYVPHTLQYALLVLTLAYHILVLCRKISYCTIIREAETRTVTPPQEDMTMKLKKSFWYYYSSKGIGVHHSEVTTPPQLSLSILHKFSLSLSLFVRFHSRQIYYRLPNGPLGFSFHFGGSHCSATNTRKVLRTPESSMYGCCRNGPFWSFCVRPWRTGRSIWK